MMNRSEPSVTVGKCNRRLNQKSVKQNHCINIRLCYYAIIRELTVSSSHLQLYVPLVLVTQCFIYEHMYIFVHSTEAKMYWQFELVPPVNVLTVPIAVFLLRRNNLHRIQCACVTFLPFVNTLVQFSRKNELLDIFSS